MNLHNRTITTPQNPNPEPEPIEIDTLIKITNSTTSFNNYSEEELYENSWKDLINKKNPATYLTGVMTAKIEKDSVTPNMSENLINTEIIKANETLMNNWNIFVKNISEEGQTMELGRTNIEDINMMDIEEEDLPTEQEAFKAAMQKHTTIPKVEAMQIENTSPWRTYHSHYLKQQIT
ncbi:31952_t:CDS:2 [Gigaspora margarita]|uniref:31952_t:CDS:1 n=1 Tax=Gigaspora margarita TaxID=4874 RepID=A0ABN7VWL3_GIGMA|nr:31952_t:CDS:2 [Gigaspora margarita]